MKYGFATVLIGLAFFLVFAGCTTPIILDNVTVSNTTVQKLTYTEGDIVDLFSSFDRNTNVYYNFSAPFDTTGKWQSNIGDAGIQYVTITSTDGKISAERKLIIELLPTKSAPRIINVNPVVVNEGETIVLRPTIYDSTNNTKITYSGFMNSSRRSTAVGDRGNYTVTVVAQNEYGEVSQFIPVTMLAVNSAPYIPPTLNTTIVAGIAFTYPNITDPDGDNMTIKYSSPLNATGSFMPTRNDVGLKTISINATDGTRTTTYETQITVVLPPNAPSLHINNSRLNATQLVNITPIITSVRPYTIQYSGWMNTSAKQTTHDDWGNHTITVSVDDGFYTIEQNVSVEVLRVNRAPVFVGWVEE